MRTRVMVIVLALGLCAGSAAFAAGPAGLSAVGIYGAVGTNAGALSGATGLSFKFGSFPVLGLTYNFTGNTFGASIDYYVIDAQGLGSSLSYFLGVGGYVGIGGGDFTAGLRVPLGLQFWPIKKLELYLSPVVSVPLLPAPSVGVGAEFGLRVHF
ncbi:MAG TPA: hypothetical protein VMC79_11795 [Rectinemataceae bacterium]|nr:hypothetical protein [Rectinemataceae bacterium]